MQLPPEVQLTDPVGNSRPTSLGSEFFGFVHFLATLAFLAVLGMELYVAFARLNVDPKYLTRDWFILGLGVAPSLIACMTYAMLRALTPGRNLK